MDELQRSRGALHRVGKAADMKDEQDESARAAGPALPPTASALTSSALTMARRRLLLDGDQPSTSPTDA